MQRFNFPALKGLMHGSDEPGSAKEFVESGRPAPSAVPPKKFSEAELEAAKAESLKEGHDKGLKEGLSNIEAEKLEGDKKIAMLLADIQAAIPNAATEFDQMLTGKTGEVLSLVTAICKKIAGDALKEFPEAKIESTVKSCLQMLMNQGAVNIFVSDKILPALQEKITALKESSGFSGEINLQADSALPETDCRIAWQNGEARHDSEKMWQEVDRLLENIKG